MIGLEFINTIRPVKFKWQRREPDNTDGKIRAGFIAQELQKAQGNNNFLDFSELQVANFTSLGLSFRKIGSSLKPVSLATISATSLIVTSSSSGPTLIICLLIFSASIVTRCPL